MKKTPEEKKRNRKGSMGAKLAAWVGITTCAVAFLGGAIGAVVMEESGVYTESEEEFRKEAYEGVAGHYAVRALHNMKNSGNNSFSDTVYRYGIIKAEDIEGLDLNDESIYVERNFTEEITPDMVYAHSYDIGKYTEFSYSGTLFGGYAVYENVQTYTTQEPINATYYNEENGIFYYEAAGEFYPVVNVTFEEKKDDGIVDYNFHYDFEQGMYRNLAVWEEGSDSAAPEGGGQTTSGADRVSAPTQPVAEVADVNSSSSASDAAASMNSSASMTDTKEVLSRKYVTFDMLWSLEPWEYIYLDKYRFACDDTEICWINNDEMMGREISEETDYRIDGGRQYLSVNHSGDGEEERYWVVSILPTDVPLGWSRDMFVQANTIVTLAYGLRYAIYPILAVLLAVGVFCFVWLIRAAGWREDTDELVMTWVDRMPFDLYLGFAVIVECILMIAGDMFYLNMNLPTGAVMLLLFCCIGWVLLLSFLTLAVRIKCGAWWKNTVCWYIIKTIYNVIKLAAENIGIFGKLVLIFAIMTIIDLFMIGILWSGTGLFIWMLIKVAEFMLLFWGAVQMQKLKEGGRQLAKGDMSHRIDTEKMYWEFKNHARNLNSISDGMAKAVDEQMKSERFKTELITNVSHDIKTPLTSIINYVDLLEKEELSNETAVGYLEVLERQSARLKKLIEDLMEASKASTGNLTVHLEKLEAGVSMVQTIGEFEEKAEASGLELIIKKPEQPVYVLADARHFWRVIDNLMNNICKYAQPGTRVYINLETADKRALLTFRNTSRYPLNISSEELMERFVRGDSSRNTEGSGLGISIAKSLMELMGGTFELYVDGDLFKVVIGFSTVFGELTEKTEENITT